MPRPGPRPYECVRRAWHSDRHRPMRGTVIQRIFRVVHESHNTATKKNREWQEKLPIVVLKAEEILYSKANSEDEYMDCQTLWDRVNDAINTIIRRDESTETGDLLPPCVEAALNLGCVPVRASRSQRHANPGSYLSPRTQEPSCPASEISDHTTNEWNAQSLPLHSGNQLATSIPVTGNSSHLVREFCRHAMPNDSRDNPTTSRNFPLLRVEVTPSSNIQFMPMERSNTSVNVGSVYPLYYGTHFQPEKPKFGFPIPRTSNSIIIGRPIFPPIAAPAKMGCCLQNLFYSEKDENSSDRVRQEDIRNSHGKAPKTGFDLSLRLGLFEEPSMTLEKDLAHDTDNFDLCRSEEGTIFSYPSPHQNKEFLFFPVDTASDRFGFHTNQQNFDGEGQNLNAAARKRKAPFRAFTDNLEDGPFFSQTELRSNQFTGQMKR
ncbi:hypothetical protein U1Q18_028354 [Sarracenia purpurea var. burkii]